ncbi:MAG: 23S rRNA (guanine(745)-N(1))-methyltransferase [Psychrobium sp.]
MIYQCPLCQSALHLSNNDKQLICNKNHSFDRAKQGYFNLLPVQNKKSKQPGDSKEMIAAREAFLAGNYYQQLASALESLVNSLVTEKACILDIGCGEGYYSRVISENNGWQHFGFDISKPAVMKAAKKDTAGEYAVASSEAMPFSNECLDVAFKVYAPVNDAELLRVLKNGGHFINVTPAPRHLWQLREFIYQEVRPHQTQDTRFTGLERVNSEHLTYKITPTADDCIRLLDMTPFAWKATPEIREKIKAACPFDIELDFLITLFNKP